MQVLISSIVYRPEQTGYRAHELAKGLIERGHQVIVITGLPSYPFGKIFDGYKFRLWQWDEIDGVRILRLPYVMNRSRSGLRRLISYTYFTFLTICGCLFSGFKPSVIWTNQLGYPALFLSKIYRCNWVHDVQDLWPEWSGSANIGMRQWLYKLLDKFQMKIYINANKVSVISKGFRRWLFDKGVPAEQIVLIPNWATSEFFYPTVPQTEIGDKYHLSDYFNVMYVGNIGVAQALDVIINAAAIIKNLKEIQIVLVGDGLEKDRLQDKALQLELDNVIFLGQKDRKDIADLTAWANVLFLHLKSEPIYDITIPSKTYSYLASSKPILAAARGDLAELINDNNVGEVVPPEDPKALALAIRDLYFRSSTDELDAIGKNALKTFYENFDAEILISRYERILQGG